MILPYMIVKVHVYCNKSLQIQMKINIFAHQDTYNCLNVPVYMFSMCVYLQTMSQNHRLSC